MADIKQAFGTSSAITCQLAPGGTGLADSAARESTAIDNGTNLYLDALVYVAVKNHASTAPTGDKAVYVYAYASEDGTNYSGGATGSDASYTMETPTHLRLIGVLNFTAAAQTKKGVFSVAEAFGGVLPRKWGIVVYNKTGASLDTTESNHTKSYSGVYQTAA